MNPAVLQTLTAFSVILYCLITLFLVRRKPAHLWTCAAAVAAGGFALYWQAYAFAKAWIPRLVMTALSSLDLFLFRANTAGNLAPFFFGEGMLPHLIILYGLLLCALWTTSLAAIHVFARKWESRVWLFFHTLGKGGAPVHLVVGLSPRNVALAASLEGKGRVIVLDDNTPAPGPKGKMNFFSVLRGISVESPHLTALRKEAPHAVVLTVSPSVRRFDRWLRRETTSVYLLSENESANVATALRLDARGQARIWFAAREDGLSGPLPISHPRLRLVDPSALSAQALKREESLYPVHFIEVGRDSAGRRAGYAASGFEAAVIGSEAFSGKVKGFLQEWGTFVGKDGQAAPLRIDIVDEIDDARFPALRWVGVCFEDDETTLRKALGIAMRHFMAGYSPERFIIAARLDHPEPYAGAIRFAKENYGIDIVPYGAVDRIWTYDSITGGETARYARAFYEGYRASAGGVSWEERETAILNSGHTDLWNTLELRRKTGQDYSDYFHRRVKMALCDLFEPGHENLYKDIPVHYEGSHYTGNDPETGRILEYLAIGEHLRWMASHLAAGYRLGPEKAEDRMTHPDLVPYEDLSETARHYDWIVVRTSLALG